MLELTLGLIWYSLPIIVLPITVAVVLIGLAINLPVCSSSPYIED